MKMFGNIKTDGAQEAGDRIGGGGVFDSAVYDAIVKLAYAGQSQSSKAEFVEVHLDIDGREFKERFYVTNRDGEPFYTDKKDGSKVYLPGFELVNDLCIITTNKALSGQDGEEKMVKLYDFDQKKDLPTQVPVLTELLGKPVKVALLRQIVDKQKKDGNGVYQNTGETREENVAHKFLHPELNVTVPEARQGLDAEFINKWTDRNAGKVFNRAKGVEGNAGAPGRPAPSGGGAPKASLFGNR